MEEYLVIGKVAYGQTQNPSLSIVSIFDFRNGGPQIVSPTCESNNERADERPNAVMRKAHAAIVFQSSTKIVLKPDENHFPGVLP